MKTLVMLSLEIAMLWTTLMMPANARVDWNGAPHWLDQTIYLPNCLPALCACDCRFGRLCLPDCSGW